MRAAATSRGARRPRTAAPAAPPPARRPPAGGAAPAATQIAIGIQAAGAVEYETRIDDKAPAIPSPSKKAAILRVSGRSGRTTRPATASTHARGKQQTSS